MSRDLITSKDIKHIKIKHLHKKLLNKKRLSISRQPFSLLTKPNF